MRGSASSAGRLPRKARVIRSFDAPMRRSAGSARASRPHASMPSRTAAGRSRAMNSRRRGGASLPALDREFGRRAISVALRSATWPEAPPPRGSPSDLLSRLLIAKQPLGVRLRGGLVAGSRGHSPAAQVVANRRSRTEAGSGDPCDRHGSDPRRRWPGPRSSNGDWLLVALAPLARVLGDRTRVRGFLLRKTRILPVACDPTPEDSRRR